MSDTFLISARDLLEIRRHECRSIENMEAHGAGDRETEYIGSRIEDSGKVWDYFIDDHGSFWYRNRWRDQTSLIMSMEEHLFPEKYKRKRHRE